MSFPILRAYTPNFLSSVEANFGDVKELSQETVLSTYIDPDQLQTELNQLSSKIRLSVKSIFENAIPEIVHHPHAAITFTGSDGRSEKISHGSPIEIQVLFDSKDHRDPELVKKIQQFVKKNPLFHHNLESKIVDTDCLISFDRKLTVDNNDDFPFPTRALDAKYLTGSEQVAKQYKERFFQQISEPQATKKISKFRTSAYTGNARKALKEANSGENQEKGFDIAKGELYFQEGEKRSIKSVKYAFLRLAQYKTAVDFCRALNAKKITTAEAATYPSSQIERINWVVEKKLMKPEEGELIKKNYAAALILYAQSQNHHEEQQDKNEKSTLKVDQQFLKSLMKSFEEFAKEEQTK